MGVSDRRLIVDINSRSRPYGVYVVGGEASKSFVESDEEGGFLCSEDEAVKD